MYHYRLLHVLISFFHKFLQVNLFIVDYNKTVFTEGMMKFAIEKLIPTLSQHGVDCVETFCSLTESDLKNIGLNIGEVKKCNLAARHMKDKKDCCPNQTDEADSKTDDE